MTPAPDLPLWAAILVSVALLAGASLTLVGAIGLLRMRNFFERVHPPTLGMTLGAACILAGSILCFSLAQSRLVLHEILIAIFLLLTSPVSLILLAEGAWAERQDSPPSEPDAP